MAVIWLFAPTIQYTNIMVGLKLSATGTKRDNGVISVQRKNSLLALRACSHEPGTVNYPVAIIAQGQALPRVHMMICCPGAMLPRVNFIAPGQIHRNLITTNLSEFL